MIIIDNKTIRKSSLSNNLTSVIYFKFDDFSFPEENWNDFSIIILNWWYDSLKRLLSNQSIQECLDFMDGPFNIKIQYLKESYFTLYFLQNDVVINEIKEIKIRDFIFALLKETNDLMRNLKSINYNDDEFDKLKGNYQILQKLIKTV